MRPHKDVSSLRELHGTEDVTITTTKTKKKWKPLNFLFKFEFKFQKSNFDVQRNYFKC